MRIHSNGNVGIGTAAPVAKLDVAGNVKIADGTQGLGKILVSDANGLASWQNSSTASNNIYNSNGTLTTDRTVTQAAHSITFTGGNFNVIPASSGTGLSVIGSSNNPVTSSPRIFSQEGLELQSNSNQGVVILNGLWPLVATNPVFRVVYGNGNNTPGQIEYLRIQGNGNVGIGTAAPAAKLDIAGNVKIADGTQGLGKILVSDANGLASWQNASTASTNIYNSNGSLISDRNVDLNGHNLAFTGTGNMGIGIANPNPNASLDLGATNQAFITNRVANTAAIANPVNGMIIYVNDNKCFKGYANGSWQNLGKCQGQPVLSDNLLETRIIHINPDTTSPYYGAFVSYHYTGGTGATIPVISVASTSAGITGLTLETTQNADNGSGEGNLVFHIKGTPSSHGGYAYFPPFTIFGIVFDLHYYVL
nr:hypothetical protein [Chryseobacterium sp. RU37D]